MKDERRGTGHQHRTLFCSSTVQGSFFLSTPQEPRHQGLNKVCFRDHKGCCQEGNPKSCGKDQRFAEGAPHRSLS